MFNLDERLNLCASFVRKGKTVADIGTDHAYLPVWLYKMGYVKKALACDVNEKPLKKGIETIEKYNAISGVTARLSNGLENIKSEECQDIIIAGMGGELITTIIDSCNWIKDKNKNLILQPMTRPQKLREYLYKNNFEIIEEKAVISDKKIYSVMLCTYSDTKLQYKQSDFYIGKLNPKEHEIDKLYIEKRLNTLKLKYNALKNSDDIEKIELLENLIKEIGGFI